MQLLTTSNVMQEQLKLSRNMIVVDHHSDVNICVTSLRYILDKPERLRAQLRSVAKLNDY